MDGDRFQKIVDWTRITFGVGLWIALFIIVILAMAAAAPTAEPYSDDQFTVAETSDGESITVTYEVATTIDESATVEERKSIMAEMDIVSACANGAIDEHIQGTAASEIDSESLEEAASGCGTDEITVRNISIFSKGLSQ